MSGIPTTGSAIKKNRILLSAISLFLEKGYTKTTTKDICAVSGVVNGTLFNFFKSKEGILYELTVKMLETQFAAVNNIFGKDVPGYMPYALETSVQLALAELSENMRELYVTAYTLPSTIAYIQRKLGHTLYGLFKDKFPGDTELDFYEREIGSSGIIRAYMSRPCDESFPFKAKLHRFLELSLSLYRVSDEEQALAVAAVDAVNVMGVAHALVDGIIKELEEQLSPVAK